MAGSSVTDGPHRFATGETVRLGATTATASDAHTYAHPGHPNTARCTGGPGAPEVGQQVSTQETDQLDPPSEGHPQ